MPLYFKLTKEFVPKAVTIVSAVLIGAAVVAIAVAGYVKDVLSSFAIFCIVMVMIFLAFFLASVIIYIYKKTNEEENPNIYSAYGKPHYRFESGRECLKSNTNHVVLFSLAMTTLVIFSSIVSVFF